jgi:hypothetical protein
VVRREGLAAEPSRTACQAMPKEAVYDLGELDAFLWGVEGGSGVGARVAGAGGGDGAGAGAGGSAAAPEPPP